MDYINYLNFNLKTKLQMERIDLEIYEWIIHNNSYYHCILFDKSSWILPFEHQELTLLTNHNN